MSLPPSAAGANGQFAVKAALFCFSTALTTAVQLSAPLSQNSAGQYEYSTQSAVLFVELSKLVIAILMLAFEGVSRSMRAAPESDDVPPLFASEPLKLIGYYFVPSFLWFVNNNLTFIALQGISPATNTAIGQSKVVFTVLLLALLLGRRFNLEQLGALALLTAVLVAMSIEEALGQQAPGAGALDNATLANSTLAGRGDTHRGSHGALHGYSISTVTAVSIALLISFIGSLAGVYNEKLLKQLSSSIHFQNLVAYTWGAGFNLVLVFLVPSSRALVLAHGFFEGYNRWTLFYIVICATMGVSVSFIYKYLDNIARICSMAAALGLLLVVQMLTGLTDRVSVLAGCMVGVIALSLFIYYDGSQRQQREEQAEKAVQQATGGTPGGAKESTPLVGKANKSQGLLSS